MDHCASHAGDRHRSRSRRSAAAPIVASLQVHADEYSNRLTLKIYISKCLRRTISDLAIFQGSFMVGFHDLGRADDVRVVNGELC